MKTILLIVALATSLAAQPQAPYSATLSTSAIQPIPLHTEIDTLLIFPKQVDSIIGNGLTSGGDTDGSVLYQQGKENPKTIILRHLNSQTKVVMTVMIADEAYVFRLEPSNDPATAIYFRNAKDGKLAEEIAPEQALIQSRSVSKERKTELLRLARQAGFLQEKLPKEYEGYSEQAATFAQTRDGLQTTVTKISRFPNDDALVFSGMIVNNSDQPVLISQCQGLLKVGEQRLYPPDLLGSSQPAIPPHRTVAFEGLLIGDGNGNPLHLSLENEFFLQLTKNK